MDTYNLFSTQFATSGPPNFAEEENEYNNEAEERERERGACRQGHRASLVLRTSAGGCICLVCFSNLFSHCSSGLAVHRAYALSQLSRALDDAMFATVLRQNQRHFLVSPLSQAIVSSRQDQTLANDITHVITKLCKVMEDDEDDAANILVQDFIHHVLLDLASSAFAWTPSLAYADFRRLIFMENTQDHLSNKHVEKWSYTVHECNKMMVDLIMSASIDPVTGSWIHRSDDDKEMKSDLMKLVAEIDKFLQESAIYVK